MVTDMITIEIYLSVVGRNAVYVYVIQYNARMMIFTTEVRNMSQFENRNSGPA